MSANIPYKSVTNDAKDQANTLNVDGITNVTDTTESTSSTTGALTVAGGVGIGKRLNVEGAVSINETSLSSGGQFKVWLPSGSIGVTTPGATNNIGMTFVHNAPNDTRYDIKLDNANDKLQINKNGGDGTVLFNDTTPSTGSNNGAVVIDGGLGIAKNLNIDGTISCNNATASSSSTTGALVLTGGFGVGGDVFTGGDLTVAEDITISDGRIILQEDVTNTLVGYGISEGDLGLKKNTIMGYQAGNSLNHSTTQQNVFVGHKAGKSITTGIYNVVLGSDCFQNAVVCTGNIVIGHGSGSTLSNATSSGNNNVFIGRSSNGADSTNNQISIGYNAVCDSADQCTIGGTSASTDITEIRPGTDNVCNLGSTSNQFKDVYMAGDFYPSLYTSTSKFIETSTWVPTVTFSTSGSLDTTFVATTGRWYRIGRMVFVTGNVVWDLSTSGTISGDIKFILPHTISSDNESDVSVTLGTMKQIRPPSSSTIAAQIVDTQNYFIIRSTPIAGGNLTTLGNTHLGGTDGFLNYSCNYLIDL